MTPHPPGQRSRFARTFERVYSGVTLPAAYREFILSDAYVRYRRAFISGLHTYGPTDVELTLDDRLLLDRDQLFDRSGLEPEQAVGYHPVATLPQSPQFLAIATTVDTAPVFLWHHETGAFHPQFASFGDFLGHLRTPDTARQERARIRQAFAEIRKVCRPALSRARRQFMAGRFEDAGAELDAALAGRRPIRYDGRNDFEAIGILCDCFNLRGRALLARGRIEEAQSAFFEATACGGTPYWEAAIDAIVTSFLLGDPAPAIARVGRLEAADFPEPPGRVVRRNFTHQQIAALRANAASAGLSDDERQFAAKVVSWISEADGGS